VIDSIRKIEMGTEPPASEKKEPPVPEQRDTQTDDRGSRSKEYRGNHRRYGKKKNHIKEIVTSKSKFKGAIDALSDYYFDTGPTQAHDFKKTHKKISTYTGTKYSAEVMQSLEDMRIFDWTRGMPRKPILTDFDTVTGSVTTPAIAIPSKYIDRYTHKMKTHCKREDKFEVDMQLCYTVIHGQCTEDMLHELKCQTTYETIKNSFDPIGLLHLLQRISYNYQAQDFPLMAIAKAQEAIYNERQLHTESNIDYLQTFKNKAIVLEAVGGSLLNDGVKKYMAESLFKLEYNKCSIDEKKQCAKKGREAMLATVYMMKADKGRYSKLLTDLHNDHLKGCSPYPLNLADAQKLLLNYSSNNKHKTKDKREENNNVSDLAFAQDGSGGGYTFTGKCFKCGKEGHRA
jgi:hypothetical protein